MEKDWMLTDQERAEFDAVGCSRQEVQEAKKRAYIDNGGVILNPDALEAMYEALKAAYNWYYQGCVGDYKTIGDMSRQALSKADSKTQYER